MHKVHLSIILMVSSLMTPLHAAPAPAAPCSAPEYAQFGFWLGIGT